MTVGKVSIDEKRFHIIIAKYHLIEVGVFGSVLRPDFNENSDVDFLITFDRMANVNLFDIIDLKAELEDLIGRTADVVEKRALKNPFKKTEILNTARIIYAT